MSGSWEQRAANSVLTGILHVETVSMYWSMGFRSLQLPGPVVPITGLPFHHARNTLCQMTLEKGFDWLFQLDSDVIPPPDVVQRLLRHGLPVVSGMYMRRSPPAGVPVMQKPAGQWVTQFQQGSLLEVDVVGAGCLLVHRSILEALQQKDPNNPRCWFDWRVDYNGRAPREECMSEDFQFCQKVRTLLGQKVIVDTGLICRHVGLGEAGLGTFGPVNSVAV